MSTGNRCRRWRLLEHRRLREVQAAADVAPYRDPRVSGLVVSNELTGLAFGLEGSRGAAARAFDTRPAATVAGQQTNEPLGAPGVAIGLVAAYLPAIGYYAAHFPQVAAAHHSRASPTATGSRSWPVRSCRPSPPPPPPAEPTATRAGPACPGCAPTMDPAAANALADPAPGRAVRRQPAALRLRGGHPARAQRRVLLRSAASAPCSRRSNDEVEQELG